MIIILSVWVFCGILSVTVATTKGQKKLAVLLGLLLAGPVGLAFELLGKKKQAKTHCPYCDELVATEGNACSLCGLKLDGDSEGKGAILSGQCPRCEKKEVHDAYLEDGSWGKWCPNCKMSIKRMRGE